jgi:hypothetical protein
MTAAQYTLFEQVHLAQCREPSVRRPDMKIFVDVVDVTRKRVEQAPASAKSIPNSDVRLLLREIDRLRKLLAPIWNDHNSIFPGHH